MKLHLPVSLRKSVIACILATAGIFPSISISAASWGIAVCLLGTPSAKAEISTVTISSSGKSELISTPDDSLIIMNLNRGYLYGSSTLNSSFDVAADVQIDSLIISDGFKLNTYNFSGDISGSGTFERTSDAKGANQTYVFTGDMSQYSGDMKFSREDDGNTFKFIGNQSGTGSISIAAGNTLVVSGATMNNSSITTAGAFNVSGRSHFAGHVTSTGELNLSGSASFAQGGEFSGAFHVSGLSSIDGSVSVNGSLNLAAGARLDNQDTLTMGAGSTLNLAAGAEILNHGTFTFGAGSTLNLAKVAASEDAQRTLTYSVFSAGSTGTSNFSSLSLENIIGIHTIGRSWSLNDNGTLVGVLNNHALSYAGGSLAWNTSSADFSKDDEKVTFTQGDDVTFSGNSSVTFGDALSAQRVTVANGAEVIISGSGSGSLALAEAVVNGTLKLQKGGQKGAFSGNVDVYGTLSVETGDVTGWSGTDGIKSIDIFAGGEMQVNVSNNQTGAGLAINLQGGSISGVSGSNFDLGYGGAIYGYSSLSALAADTATAETPTVSTIENCNITLRQYHTTISVEKNARLDILSGILVKDNKSDLNGEGAVPSHLQAGLVKTGAGELRLSGNNTYTQATTVAEGTLALTGGAALASSSVIVNSGAVFKLDTAADTSINYANQISGSGLLLKTGAGSAAIGGLADSFAGHIDLQQGTLSVGSPVVISSGRELSLGMTGAVLDSDLSLGDGRLNIDYSGSGAATSLNNSALTLLGGTRLQLSSLGSGDGKTYELFSGISSLLGSDGSALALNSSNNAISNYFDTSQPGSGFWKDATLVLTDDGTLQLVRHNQAVQAAKTITSRQTSASYYQYYSSLAFIGCSTSSYGGAIYVGDGTVAVNNNGNVIFRENATSSDGGVIYGSRSDSISLSNNGIVDVSGNSASYGGAIYGYDTPIYIEDNGTVIFCKNTSSNYGGAIYAQGSDKQVYVSIEGNGYVEFSGNTGSVGGVIYGDSSSTIELSNNGSVSFIDNSASSFGGAIYGEGNTTLSNNSNVSFSGNSASYRGGAIYGGGNISLCNNGSISFIDNSASYYGGAIYGGKNISLNNNDSVLFSGNSAYYSGAAICTYGNLSIQNNDSVSFYQNAEVKNGSYRLRSIYAGGSGDVISLSAAAGNHIEFQDSIYIDRGSTFNLNADYTDAGNKVHQQHGDILFTGKYTESHLNALLAAAEAGRTATAEEILSSRTTEVCAMTNLYGGRLRVEDGAIYKGYGITAMEDSESTVRVKDATLDHSDYELTFTSGTTLELAGNNTIIGDVQMLEGSILCFDGRETKGTTSLTGNLSFASGVDISLKNGSDWTGENEILLYVDGSVSGWDDRYFEENSDIRWVNGDLLVLNYNKETFIPWFRGDIAFTTRQTNLSSLKYYNSIDFSVVSSSSYGGAIYGGSSSTIELSNNGSVTFSGNSSSSYGGAIYGGSSSTIELSNNGSVTFSGNAASSSGGAICTSGNLSIQNNDSVSFYQNAEVKNGSYRLRSIYAGGSGDVISLSAAAEGKNITFRDSIYIASGSTFNLNETYGDREQKGDIIFTGSTTVDDLLAVKGSAGTVEEILNSRTSEVYTMTNLYGGRLRVEDGAIYKGYGITAMEGSAATVRVKDAELQHKDYDLTFHAGTTLELAGNNTITGNIQMQEGSTLSFDGRETKGMTSLTGNLSFASGVDISLKNGSDWTGENEILLYVDGSVSGWDDRYFEENSDIRWVNGDLLVLNYNKETFAPRFNGDITFATRQTSTSLLRYYNSVRFENIASSSSGGALYGGNMVLSDNGTVIFSGNTMSSSYNNGGAIYSYGNLNIRNNDSVEFYQNAEVRDGSYRLRSIYAGGSEDIISFSAGEGKNITFRDSVYIASGSTFNLNETYGDREQKGDIIFTGATTVNDLYKVKGNVDGTESEILASRTSEVYTMTNLYGGRLRVEDGAIYKGYGITAMEGSAATVRVKDASLAHSGYDLIFTAGTTFELEGNARVFGNVQMLEGSSLSLIVSKATDVAELSGQLDLAGSMTIKMGGDSTWTGENRILMYLDGGISGWEHDKLSVTGSQIYGKEDVEWVDNLLVLNYNAETFNRYYNGSATHTTKLTNAVLHHFSELRFEDIIGDAKGGAIEGYAVVSENGKVVFCGNRTSTVYSDYYSGSAIYATSGLSIQNNDSVEFYQNAVLQGEYVRLKSIYAESGDVNLAASKGKNILFRDSIYLASACNLNLNRGAGDKLYEGDIIFTGATTEDDLLAVKGSAGTELEISESRRSVVNAMTNLYGGRLLVEEGAEYMGLGITAHEGSAATVRVQNASLMHAGYDLTFNSGTMLELLGNNTIMGDVQMLEGSSLMLNAMDLLGMSSIAGNLNISGEMTLALGGNANLRENSILLYVSGEIAGENEDRFTISGGVSQDGVSATWVDNLLVLNYNADTFDRFFNKTVTYTTQQAPTLYHHYEDIRFTNVIGATSSGGYYDDNGAIHGTNVILNHNGSVNFSNNEAGGYGGGIYGTNIELAHNGTVTFNENSALNGNGGAIYGIPGSSVRIHHNANVCFSKNTAARYGGAIGLNSTASNGRIELSHNGSVEFSENEAISSAGAIYGGTIILNHNGSLKFSDNKSGQSAGAIQGSAITLSYNGSVDFTGNSATGGSSGAIDGTSVIISNNDSVKFSLNSSGNNNGGAITARTLYLCDNHSVVFNENSAVNGGGAIYAINGLNIQNNDSVEFYQNALVKNGIYKLRSITANGGPVNMSAAEGKSIIFRDSIYVGTGNTISLNADYTDAEEKVHEQQGDIIFTGKTTVNDLYIVKGNVDGTEEEIQASRTSEFRGTINLYGGRLRVEEQAVLKTSAGLTVAEGSNATVKIDNAELDAGTGNISIGATGTLELSNGAILRANEIIIDDEATLALSCSELQTRATFALSEAVAAGTTAYNTGNTVVIDGDLTLNGGATLVADNAHFIMTEGSVLTFNASVEKKINLVLTMGTVYEPDVPITLFTGVESMRFIYNGTELTDSAAVNPGDFFTGAWINESTTFTYDAEAGAFCVMNVNSLSIPEPTTTTLGLLALAGLAARRRRLD